MRKLLCVCFSLVLLFSLPLHAFAATELNKNSSTKEQFEVVHLGRQHEIIYYEDAIIEDITTEEYRKTITQTETGTSIFYEDFSTGIATLSVNGIITETYNMEQLRSECYSWSMPAEDKALLAECLSNQNDASEITLPSALRDKYMVTYNNSGDAIISPTPDPETYSVRASYTPVRPAGPVTDTYPEYTYKEIATALRYSSYCARYIDMAIKDSMYNYTQIDKTFYPYAAQTAVSAIAYALKISTSTLMGCLSGFITLVNNVYKTTTNIELYFSEKYMFSALRQVYVYDYTNYNRDVSVLTYHGEGEISLTWDFVNNEYTNPSYRITGIAYPHTLAYSDLYDEAMQIWEVNMYQHGYWKWGDV